MTLCFLAAANSIHSVRWIKYFNERGHKIVWVSLAPPIPEAAAIIPKIRFYEIKPSPLNDINGRFALCHLPFALRQVKKIIKNELPQLLHIHSAGTYGLIGALSGFHPTILTPWGSDILLTSIFKKPLIRYVIRKMDSFTCDGENTFQKLVEFGANPEKIKIIRFGTDVEKFKPSLENRKQKIENRIVKIISLRTLIPIYDIETLVKAAAIVVKTAPETKFVIVGDGEQKEYLEQIANRLGLIDSGIVKFIGKINNDLLPSYLQSADIYVSTSLSDSGLAASTAEAMASGLPAIVTDSGDNKKWVEENKGGFVIPLKNPEILAKKIVYLLRNPNVRKSFGEYNRKIIEEKNNYYKEMGKTERLYENVIRESRK